jgi:hypothetical protein
MDGVARPLRSHAPRLRVHIPQHGRPSKTLLLFREVVFLNRKRNIYARACLEFRGAAGEIPGFECQAAAVLAKHYAEVLLI